MARELKKVTEKVKEEIMNVAESPNTLFSKEEKTAYKKLLTGINNDLKKTEKSYLDIAFRIQKIYQNRLFEIDGFKNIYELASEKFDLARGTCNNFINIVEVFGQFDKESNSYIGLKEEYQAFSRSQLIVMLSIAPANRPQITADMSVRAIKEKKKEFDTAEHLLEMEDFDGADIYEEPDGEAVEESEAIPSMNDVESDIQEIVKEVNHMNVIECSTVAQFKKQLEENLVVLNDTWMDFKENNKDLHPKIVVSFEW